MRSPLGARILISSPSLRCQRTTGLGIPVADGTQSSVIARTDIKGKNKEKLATFGLATQFQTASFGHHDVVSGVGFDLGRHHHSKVRHLSTDNVIINGKGSTVATYLTLHGVRVDLASQRVRISGGSRRK